MPLLFQNDALQHYYEYSYDILVVFDGLSFPYYAKVVVKSSRCALSACLKISFDIPPSCGLVSVYSCYAQVVLVPSAMVRTGGILRDCRPHPKEGHKDG